MTFKKILKYTILTSLLIGFCMLIPIGCMVVGIRTVEEAGYTLIEKDNKIEIREYDELVAVATWVDEDFKTSGNTAFRRLFNYISGNNKAKDKIAMTAPVITNQSKTKDGEKIAMTAPVISHQSEKGWRFMFVLPASYTLETAPEPLDERVKLIKVPQRKMAVIRFSGSWNHDKSKEKIKELQEWLKANNLKEKSLPNIAGYDPPFTIPALRRNEVMIEIQ